MTIPAKFNLSNVLYSIIDMENYQLSSMSNCGDFYVNSWLYAYIVTSDQM